MAKIYHLFPEKSDTKQNSPVEYIIEDLNLNFVYSILFASEEDAQEWFSYYEQEIVD